MELDGQPVEVSERAVLTFAVSETGALALYNYGHFTTMKVEESRVRGLSLHLDRLVHDCRLLHGAELDPGKVRALVRDAARERAQMVRVTVFDPELDLGHPGNAHEPRVLITTRPAMGQATPPVRLRSVEHQRYLPHVKHVGIFSAVHARREVQREGYDDALFHQNANVSEGATWNIGFLRRRGEVVWPDADVLPGVTMRLLGGGSQNVTLTDTYEMEGAFIANAAIGIRPVASIDGRPLRLDEDALRELRRRYEEIPAELL